MSTIEDAQKQIENLYKQSQKFIDYDESTQNEDVSFVRSYRGMLKVRSLPFSLPLALTILRPAQSQSPAPSLR